MSKPVAISPSMFDRRRVCAAVALVQHNADPEYWGITRSTDAKRGTDLHDVADKMAKGKQPDLSNVSDAELAAVQMYLQVVAEEYAKYSSVQAYGTEYFLSQEHLYGPEYANRKMYADCLISGVYPQGERVTTIVDAKFGVGTLVPANEPELGLHGLSYMAAVGLWNAATGSQQFTTLRTVVVQPLFKDQTLEPVRVHTWTEAELSSLFRELQEYLATDNANKDVPLDQLPDHLFKTSNRCYADCAWACPYVRRQIEEISDLKIAYKPKENAMSEIDDDRAQRMRMNKTAIENALKQATAIVKRDARQGKGAYVLDHSHKTAIWAMPLEEMVQRTGIPKELFYAEPEMLSPKAVLARLRAQGYITQADALQALLGEKTQERLVQDVDKTANATMAFLKKGVDMPS